MKALPNNLNVDGLLVIVTISIKNLFIPLSTAHSIQQESKTANSGRVSQLANIKRKPTILRNQNQIIKG